LRDTAALPLNPFDIALDQILYGLPISALVLALGDIQLKAEASARTIEAPDVQTAKPNNRKRNLRFEITLTY